MTRPIRAHLASLAGAACLAGCGSTDPMIVEIDTAQGPVAGQVSERGVADFRAIPYAAPPVGDLRWRPPAPAPRWTETRQAMEFSPMCMQSTDGPSAILDRLVDGIGVSAAKRFLIKRIAAAQDSGEVSEDCLYLNVRTPEPSAGADLPVMVWIHGGGHQFGSADFSIYQGDDLPARGVVLVTINYRLNAFGYMAHPALSAESGDGASGNYGLRDQIAALEWVRDHITEYGGDPGNVTVFGESAGASSIAALIASPRADGLFARAIMESGEATQSFTTLRGDSRGPSAESVGEAIMAALPGAPATVEDMRALDASDILNAVDFDTHSGTLRPIGDGVMLPASVPELLARGDIRAMPAIVGYNADEAGIFYDGPENARLRPDLGTDDAGEQLAELQRVYGEAAGAEIARLYDIDGPDNHFFDVRDLMGDEYFGLSTRFVLERLEAEGAPVWAYAFTRVPPSDSQTIGAFHSAEMPFVFGTHEPALGLSEEDEALTDLMQAYWVSFARDGDPNAPGLPGWPRYGGSNWMEFTANTGGRSGAIRDWRKAKLDALEAGLDPVLLSVPVEVDN